ncbi:MAG: imelysin family protein [Pseudomonadota bacterium]
MQVSQSSNFLCKSLVTTVAFTVLMGCGGGGGGDGTPEPATTPPPTAEQPVIGEDNFDGKAALLANIVQSIITPAFTKFVTSSNDLSISVTDYCAGLGGAEETALLDDARIKWQTAMLDYQKIELMQVGPLIANDSELRNRFYSYPVVSTCAVDQHVINFENNVLSNGSAFDINLTEPNRLGLDTLEYLLFNRVLTHSCPDQVTVTSDDNWNVRTDAERIALRCNYAEEVAKKLNTDANALVAAWDPNGVNQFINAGSADSAFATEKVAINAISDALFYSDTVLKDEKLAKAIGIAANSCSGAICTQDLESQFAKTSKEQILANLQALQEIFLGNTASATEEGVGFDDYLIALDGETLASTIAQDIAKAIASTNNVEGNLFDALTTSQAQVEQIHDDIKTVTDQLKTDFINQLGLELPATAAGDND